MIIKTRRTPKLSNKGFTLVELLVVIAIISVLGAVVAPNAFKAIERSQTATDQANVRTLNQVTAFYGHEMGATGDIFEGFDTDQERIEELVKEEFLEQEVKPKRKNFAFVWDIDAQRWLYQSTDTEAPFSTHYLLTPSDYLEGWGSHVLGTFLNESEKNIQIPEGITTIQGGLNTAAFLNKGLESVILSESLVRINSHAFLDNNLTEILIPENVIHIGHQSFRNNPITKITMTSDPNQVVIETHVFGTGWTEAENMTNAFKAAYSSGGPGTYEWDGSAWIKE